MISPTAGSATTALGRPHELQQFTPVQRVAGCWFRIVHYFTSGFHEGCFQQTGLNSPEIVRSHLADAAGTQLLRSE
jgi:hypothetical protein